MAKWLARGLFVVGLLSVWWCALDLAYGDDPPEVRRGRFLGAVLIGGVVFCGGALLLARRAGASLLPKRPEVTPPRARAQPVKSWLYRMLFWPALVTGAVFAISVTLHELHEVLVLAEAETCFDARIPGWRERPVSRRDKMPPGKDGIPVRECRAKWFANSGYAVAERAWGSSPLFPNNPLDNLIVAVAGWLALLPAALLALARRFWLWVSAPRASATPAS
jgi:hypothetical protein